MLKRNITYTNPLTDQTVTEEHFFHISKADLLEMQMENLNAPEVRDPQTGEKLEGYRAMLQRVINDRDGTGILKIVKDLIRRSYGKKEGDRFVRSPEIFAEFEGSGAYAQLYFDLCTDAEAQSDFMNGVLPKELMAEAQAVAAKAQTAETGTSPAIAAVERAGEQLGADMSDLKRDVMPRVLTQAEMLELDSDDLKSGLATGRYTLAPTP